MSNNYQILAHNAEVQAQSCAELARIFEAEGEQEMANYYKEESKRYKRTARKYGRKDKE